MATRAHARGILDRSRVLLDRSRVVAAQLLDPPRHRAPVAPAPEPEPRSADPAAPAIDVSLGEVCSSIALRDLNLIDTLLAELEVMERREDDSARLGRLYRLDHLAARLRRNAENLRVLADGDSGEAGGDPVSVLDTIRGAMSSIDQYSRIGIGRTVPLGVVGLAADDLSRVLTELLDNAANHSPPSEEVRVSAHLTELGSVLLRIEDGGIGLPPDRLMELNARLAGEMRLDDDAVRHMGLAVVRRLARRHGLQVALHRRLPHGTTATVVVPPSLVCELPEKAWSGSQTVPVADDTVPVPASPPRNVPLPPLPAVEVPPVPVAPVSAPAPEAERPRPSPTRRTEPARNGTTVSGLPRRVSHSIKDTGTPDSAGTGSRVAAVSPEPLLTADPDGHDQFLADLGAFADGEQAARATPSPTPTPAAEVPPPAPSDLVVDDDPVLDDPVLDDPVLDDPVADAPAVDAPVVDAPVVDDLVVDDDLVADPEPTTDSARPGRDGERT